MSARYPNRWSRRIAWTAVAVTVVATVRALMLARNERRYGDELGRPGA